MDHKRATVLVVDDTPENIDVLRGLLRPYYRIQIAINGQQALKRAASDTPPDLILLDVMMPGMDGYEVCRHLKNNPLTASIPVIFVTAMNEAHDEVLGFEVGGVDYIGKPIIPAVVLARVRTHLQLRSTYRFIRDAFGRYLSEDIVDSLMDSPHGLKLGGEQRQVTILMADIRGFTSLSERLPPETVVEMLNIFLAAMTDLILEHHGTIDEFIGDAILAIFGAPLQRDDDVDQALRCAIRMQQAMAAVNQAYSRKGFPQVEMGIGLNTGEVIVGNIGSQKRSKYAVVGRAVNLASRIESYTVGGQILISEYTRHACTQSLQIAQEICVTPKGLSHEITVFDLRGIAGEKALALSNRGESMFNLLSSAVPLQMRELAGSYQRKRVDGELLAIDGHQFEVRCAKHFPPFTNLYIVIQGQDKSISFYAKVLNRAARCGGTMILHTTSISEEVREALKAYIVVGGEA